MGKLAAGALVDAVRTTILDGGLRPGTRLDETRLGAQFEVSRNTLREARDVYETRRLLELGALREAALRRVEPRVAPEDRRRVSEEVWETEVFAIVEAAELGRRAGLAGDRDAVGTADGQSRLALAALAGNDVLLRTLRSLVTEMRLLFLVVAAAREAHEPDVEDNLRIASLVEAGELVRAAILLEDYLLRAEQHLVGLCAGHVTGPVVGRR